MAHVIEDVGETPPDGALTADPGPTTTQISAALRADAQAQLAASDSVAVRCLKAGKAYPAEWLARDQALRAIVRTGAGAIPTAIDYPAGT